MTHNIDGFTCYDADLALQNEDFDKECFPIFQKYIPENFWYKSRNKIIAYIIEKKILKNYNKESSLVFWEIGCGNGYVIKHLKNKFPALQYKASDIYVEALKYAVINNPENVDLFQYNLFNCNYFDNVNIIGNFDVLEHIDDDNTAIKNIYDLLPINGYAILTVPSDMNLWSNNDIVNKHKRRYSKKGLKNKLTDAGFKIEFISNFVFLLYPLLLIKAKTQKKITENKILKNDIVKHLNLEINPIINKCFYILMSIELFFLKLGLKFPFGSSIICLIKKK